VSDDTTPTSHKQANSGKRFWDRTINEDLRPRINAFGGEDVAKALEWGRADLKDGAFIALADPGQVDFLSQPRCLALISAAARESGIPHDRVEVVADELWPDSSAKPAEQPSPAPAKIHGSLNGSSPSSATPEATRADRLAEAEELRQRLLASISGRGQAAEKPSAEKSAALSNRVPPAQPNRAARRRARHDREKVEQTLHRFCRNGDVIEIRALNCAPRRVTVSGYFDSDHLTEAAGLITRRDASGIYITLNPVKSDLLARAANRLVERPKSTTADGDIDRREWLFIDFDPVRASGISATDQEKQQVFERAEECREYLAERGWVAPLVADSGNGAHLLYPIALPNDNDGRVLHERVLKVLDLRFSDKFVGIDLKTFNAARITKLYGTVAAKGDDTVERPHRVSAILEDPQLRPDEIVTEEQLRALGALLPEEPAWAVRGGIEFDLEDWIRRHNPPIRGPFFYGSDLKWLGLRGENCLFGGDHNSDAFFLIKRSSGPIQAGCHHDSCAEKTWREFRLKYEPDAYSPRSNLSAPRSELAPPVAGNKQNQPLCTGGLVLPGVFTRSEIQVLNWQQLREKRRAHTLSWIAKGWLARGEISLWQAKVEHGKTSVMRELAICGIRGEPFLEHDMDKCRVFYAMLDADTPDLVYDEFEKMGMNDDDLPNIKFMFEPMLAAMENGPEQFFRALYEWRPDLVIIEPFTRLKRIDDFNTYSNTYLMAMLAEYARVLDAHFVLPVHISRGRPSGAAAATAGYGSIAFGAGANARFVIERKEGTDVFVLRTSKGKSAGFEAMEGERVLDLDLVTNRVTLGKPFTFGQQAAAFKDQVFDFLENNSDQDWTSGGIAKQLHVATGIARVAANMLYDDKKIDRSGKGQRKDPFLFAKKGSQKQRTLVS
jgi:hypothetical protein